MVPLKLVEMGSSVGVVIPEEQLARLGVAVGDALQAVGRLRGFA